MASRIHFKRTIISGSDKDTMENKVFVYSGYLKLKTIFKRVESNNLSFPCTVTWDGPNYLHHETIKETVRE